MGYGWIGVDDNLGGGSCKRGRNSCLTLSTSEARAVTIQGVKQGTLSIPLLWLSPLSIL
jgi:hypothetical protein